MGRSTHKLGPLYKGKRWGGEMHRDEGTKAGRKIETHNTQVEPRRPFAVWVRKLASRTGQAKVESQSSKHGVEGPH